MEAYSALLAICARNSPVPSEFPAQRPVTRSFDVFFDLRLNKRLSKQSWGWRLCCHSNDNDLSSVGPANTRNRILVVTGPADAPASSGARAVPGPVANIHADTFPYVSLSYYKCVFS